MAGWVGGSYSDIKTNLSQVGLDWDWAELGYSLIVYFDFMIISLVRNSIAASIHGFVSE